MAELEKQRALASRITGFRSNTLKEGRANFSQGFLRSRIDLLEEYWRRFQSSHSSLLGSEAQDDEYFTTDVFATVELQYSSTLGFLYDERSSLTSNSANDSAEDHCGPRPSSAIRLPKIPVPTFSGLIEDWESFRDVFRSMVHLNPTLSDVEKLQFLKSSVQGTAKRALDRLPIIQRNYNPAWNLLLQRYEHKRLLVHHHMSSLASISAAKVESEDNLRSLYDRVVSAQESLRSLGLPTKHWDDWLVFFLLNGLDPVTRADWEKSIGSSQELPTFSSLTDFVNGRIRALQSTHRMKAPQSTSQPPRRAIRTLATTGKGRSCPVCRGDHALHRCSRPPSEIYSAVQRMRHCYNCLQSGHRQSQCPSSYRCRHCHQNHHSMLHEVVTLKRVAPNRDDEPVSKRSRSASQLPVPVDSPQQSMHQ